MKDLKISRELLENVLDFKIEKFQVIGTSKVTQIRIRKENNYSDVLNDYCIDIHHFAFKCKEWASKKSYELYSYGKECFLYDTNELYDCSEQLSQWSEWFGSDTEVEAIIKACEWILENKSN